jgi:hypothetical protein
MKPKNFTLLLFVALFGCETGKSVLQSGKTYENFRGFEPIDPTEYDDSVSIVSAGSIVRKDIKTLKSDEIFSFLNNETVLLSIGQLSAEGGISYLPITVSAKNTSYKVTMDYMKFATLAQKEGNVFLGFKRVGVGLRLISLITTSEAGINIGDLSSIGLAAKTGKLTGTLMVEIVGIKSREVTNLLPLPSEINQTTIQNAMQSMATIKSKIYDDETGLYPQVMAVKLSEVLQPDNRPQPKRSYEEKQQDSTIRDNKIKLQLSNSKDEASVRLEYEAFQYLFEKDINKAIQKFQESEKIYPTYHNNYEITRLLNKEKQDLLAGNSAKWKLIYQKILDTYSWKLSPAIKDQLNEKVKL